VAQHTKLLRAHRLRDAGELAQFRDGAFSVVEMAQQHQAVAVGQRLEHCSRLAGVCVQSFERDARGRG
jgi:hypothetical protein